MEALVEEFKKLNENLKGISDSLANIDSHIENIGEKYLDEISRDMYFLAHGSNEKYVDDGKHSGIEDALGALYDKLEELEDCFEFYNKRTGDCSTVLSELHDMNDTLCSISECCQNIGV